jgi:hypothetical protein
MISKEVTHKKDLKVNNLKRVHKKTLNIKDNKMISFTKIVTKNMRKIKIKNNFINSIKNFLKMQSTILERKMKKKVKMIILIFSF